MYKVAIAVNQIRQRETFLRYQCESCSCVCVCVSPPDHDMFIRSEPVVRMMEESVSTFETHLTAVMDSLIRASVCEITKLFQETVNDYLVELSLNRRENEALKLRLRLTENKLRTERKYGMGWAANRRNAGLSAAEEGAGGGRQKRKVDGARKYLRWPFPPKTRRLSFVAAILLK